MATDNDEDAELGLMLGSALPGSAIWVSTCECTIHNPGMHDIHLTSTRALTRDTRGTRKRIDQWGIKRLASLKMVADHSMPQPSQDTCCSGAEANKD